MDVDEVPAIFTEGALEEQVVSSSRSRRAMKRLSRPETRDWATLPVDALLEIFRRVDAYNIFWGVEHMCKAWRHVAVEEPKLWRRVDMTYIPPGYMDVCVYDAVERSKGLMEAFSGPWDNHALLFIGAKAQSLKSLHLSYHNGESDELLMLVFEKLPLLEYLDIAPPFYCLSAADKLFETVCKACPLLKDLKIWFTPPLGFDFDEAILMEIVDGDIYRTPPMPELRSLEVYNFVFSNEQLEAILDNCPLVESLRITGHYVDGVMDENLRAKCAGVKNFSIPFQLNPREEDSGDSDFSDEDEP